MGRAAIKWTLNDLSEASEVATSTIRRFENGETNIKPRTLRAIRSALEDAGVVFIDSDEELGAGVRLKLSTTHAEE